MYNLTVDHGFSAAHRLRIEGHKCEALHGHNWKVSVTVKGRKLDERGMLIDFSDLKKIIRSIVDPFDHKYLNDIPPFDTINPTTENLCRIMAERIAEMLPKNILVHEVRIFESEGKSGEYFPNELSEV